MIFRYDKQSIGNVDLPLEIILKHYQFFTAFIDVKTSSWQRYALDPMHKPLHDWWRARSDTSAMYLYVAEFVRYDRSRWIAGEGGEQPHP